MLAQTRRTEEALDEQKEHNDNDGEEEEEKKTLRETKNDDGWNEYIMK